MYVQNGEDSELPRSSTVALSYLNYCNYTFFLLTTVLAREKRGHADGMAPPVQSAERSQLDRAVQSKA